MSWLLLLVSYLLGAIPFSYIAGKVVCGIDLREHGSGNLGATNAFRVLGPRLAAPVMILDLLKGFAPTYFLPELLASGQTVWALAFGAAAIVGHVFPVYMGFRGGKGVATGAGVFLALAPVAVLMAIVVWLIVLGLSHMVSLASILAAVALIIALPFSRAATAVQVMGIAVGAFVIVAHRDNIRRILRGEEHRFGARKAPADEEVR